MWSHSAGGHVTLRDQEWIVTGGRIHIWLIGKAVFPSLLINFLRFFSRDFCSESHLFTSLQNNCAQLVSVLAIDLYVQGKCIFTPVNSKTIKKLALEAEGL